MIKIFVLLILCISQLVYSETNLEKIDKIQNTDSSQDKNSESEFSQKDDKKTRELIVYRDRCIFFTQINAKRKEISVPMSIDPKSILFDQEVEKDPGYEIVKESEEAATLVLHPEQPFSGRLIYGFTGINWYMHYVVELDQTFSKILKLSGFITADNQSGVDFPNINLRLIDSKTDNTTYNQKSTEYAVDIAQNLQKNKVIRIPWINLHNQDVGREYRFDVGGENLLNFHGIAKLLPLQVGLRFQQSAESKKDLADGELSFYVKDKDGSLKFLGVNQLNSVKSGEPIQFTIPSHLLAQLRYSQDSPLSQIQGKLEQTEFKILLTEKLEEASYRFTIHNFSSKEVNIKVILPLSNKRIKVVRESNENQQENAKEVYWQIKVPPKSDKCEKGEVVLRYRVQITKE